MFWYNLFCVTLVIWTNILVDCISALNVEEIIGGYPAFRLDFKYHVALIGTYNYTKVPFLLGSAGILNNYYLISAARCFMLTNYDLKKISFYAAPGVDSLRSKDLNLIEINQIYTYYYRAHLNKNNIALSKLKDSLDLENSPNLAPLEIPSIHESYYGRQAVVAGFGIDSIKALDKQKRREQVRITSKTGLFLKYANVTIVNAAEYTNDGDLICDEVIRYFTDLCGIMKPDDAYDYRGVCMGDNGAPLVVDKHVVGIVSTHSPYCNDITIGTVYAKVTKFKEFIFGVLLERHLIGTKVYNTTLNGSQTPQSSSEASRSEFMIFH